MWQLRPPSLVELSPNVAHFVLNSWIMNSVELRNSNVPEHTAPLRELQPSASRSTLANDRPLQVSSHDVSALVLNRSRRDEELSGTGLGSPYLP